MSTSSGVSLRWLLTSPVLRLQAVIFAALSWTFAALLLARNTLGTPLGLDFVYFYTIGALVVTGRSAALYNDAAYTAAQAEFVPATASVHYLSVYPPQMALVFSPLALLPYQVAAATWACITALGYVGIVWIVWRRLRHELRDSVLVWAAVVAFPPFWHLVLFGQNSILILSVFFLGWRALESRRSFLAGAAFGLLAIKPQFGLPLVAIVVARREWAMLAGAAVSVAAQVLAVVVVVGRDVLVDYVNHVPLVLASADRLEQNLYKSVSVRTLTRLLPSSVALPVWAGLAIMVLVGAARAWVSAAPLRVRMGVVMLAAVLVSPHLLIYDVVLLAPPLLWCGAWVEAGQGPRRELFWPAVYGLFVGLAMIMPVSMAIGAAAGVACVALVVLLIVWIFCVVITSTRTAPVDAPSSVGPSSIAAG